MGYVLVHGCCLCCNKVFSFNPKWVPSIRVNGVREGVCADCIARANLMRVANGLPEIVVHPDAYSAANEDDISWST